MLFLSPDHREVLDPGRAGTYDDRIALALAEHAAAVYAAPHDYAGLCVEAGFDGGVTIERGCTQIGIAYAPWGIVISARGSEQCGDWGENLLAFRWGWKGVIPEGRLHFGFLVQARRVAGEFRKTFKRIRRGYGRAPVWIAGHSLGAALSPILRVLLDADGERVEAIYPFNMPRTGNRAWASWYDGRFGDRTYRVVVYRKGVQDLVTRVPLSRWGFEHLGQPVILRDGRRYENEEAWERVRAEADVRVLDQWRIVSRLRMGVQAHLARTLVADLRSNLDDRIAPAAAVRR